jgi:hypothetical protein
VKASPAAGVRRAVTSTKLGRHFMDQKVIYSRRLIANERGVGRLLFSMMANFFKMASKQKSEQAVSRLVVVRNDAKQ